MNTRTIIFTVSACFVLTCLFLTVGPPVANAEVLVGGTVVAQAPPDACDADTKGEEILTAAKNMTNAACNSAAIVMSDRSGLFSDSVKTQLDDKCTRSQNWVNASGRASDLAKMGKKGSAQCYVAEIEGDGVGDDDGICSPDEKYSKKDDRFGCMEDDSDASGDNDGICELLQQGHGKKVWESCLEVCDTPEDNPDVTDCTTLDHMTGALQDAADALESANTQIAARLQTYNALQASMPESADSVAVGTECLTASSASFGGFTFPGGSRSSQYSELRDALLAAEFLEEIANICLDAADTTIFGTDASAVCIVAHGGQAAASIISSGWELLDDAITGTRVDNISLCVEQMGSQLNAMQDLLNIMDRKLDTIMDYLNTPQGRRPEFPLK